MPDGSPAKRTTDDLVLPAAEIFDRDTIEAAIAAGLKDAPASEQRKVIVEILGDARVHGMQVIADALACEPFRARPVTRSYSYLHDCLVVVAVETVQKFIHKIGAPTTSERLSLVAVGGFGRGEMAPYSDVDLLFLTPLRVTAWAESVIESTLYILWDLKLKVGHASRTIRDCIKLGKEDYTIRTALLEQRYLTGDEDLAQELHDKLRSDLFKNTESEFVEAKLEERGARHKRQGGQRYVLEPNVKEGKGGLRDLQSLYWMAKYVHHVESTAELVDLGVFQAEEFQKFAKAEEFLWAVRCHLHLISKRAMDTLTFDVQVDVAERMNFKDGGGRRGVEHFMQEYFRHATRVGELTRIFLTALEAAHAKKEPLLSGLLRKRAHRKKIKPEYTIRQGRLDLADANTFLDDPRNLLRMFDEALRTNYLLHPDAMRLAASNLDKFDKNLRADPVANRIFLDLLLKRGNPERALRRMNELGVLGAFIPEFQTIVSMMQFNVYHQFTVDEHTIQCVSILAQIERGELVEELPIASGILKSGEVNRKILYAAVLLHDIGKGRDEDHSVLGARISRRVANQLGLKPSEEETVVWLVRYHLLMSDMAQKRDLSDPRTVRDFAKAVKTRERLDLLTVLTVCDIRGVGPSTWNNWKAQLLRSLYAMTEDALTTGLEDLNREKRGAEAKKALRQALADWDKADLRKETSRHYDPYWQGLPSETHVVIAKLLRRNQDDDLCIDLAEDIDRDVTQVTFVLQDHPGIFARLAGALALVGANTVDARTYTTKDGFIAAVFWVQDAEGAAYDVSRFERLKRMIERTLKGEFVTREALVSRDKIKKRDAQFKFPTSISFDNEGSEIFTIIEVDTRDRPGLLHDIARVLADSNIYVSSAQIATYGAQAVDSFYVKDMFGLKLHSKSKQEALATRIRKAIAHGFERAQA